MASRLRHRLALTALPAMLILLAACGDQPEEPAAPATPAPAAPAATPTPAPAAPTPAPVVPTPVAPATPAATPPAQNPVAPAPAPAATAAPPAAAANPEGVFTGVAEAVEGDVIRIGTTRFLLYGIDTVEPPQTCEIDRQPWECWPAVVRQLQTFLGEGPVTCTQVRPDMFGRILALCEQNGLSLNERMVRSGFALAVRDEMPEYVAIEAEARAARIGLWQGTFQPPDEWRADRGINVRRP